LTRPAEEERPASLQRAFSPEPFGSGLITALIQETNMKPMLCTSFLLASVTVFSFVARGNQPSPDSIPRSSSVFIDPMDGFGPELQEALLNNGVPLVIASNKDNADFEIIGGIRDARGAANKWTHC
jgi:hypothetical protein